ncbi:MAG: acyltransferase [Lachnospiraceae bacterium]|nr:acyltransferase [Lachnospiraceae bacterium]
MAAYLVLVGHGISVFEFSIAGQRGNVIQNSGVVLLFLLSGFLTAYSLENSAANEEFCYKSYVKKRAIRIYREYLPALIFIILIDNIGMYIFGEYPYHDNTNVVTFIGNLLMIHGTPLSLCRINPFGSGRPLWTLPVQWWLYLLYGKLFFIVKKKNEIDYKGFFLLGICAIVPVFYLIDVRKLPMFFWAGVLVYYIYDYITINHTFLLAAITFLLGAAVSIILKEAYNLYTCTLYMAGFALLMAYGKNREFKSNKVLKTLANITFLIYLTHYSIMIFIDNFAIGRIEKLCWLTVVSSVTAYGLYKLVNLKK